MKRSREDGASGHMQKRASAPFNARSLNSESRVQESPGPPSQPVNPQFPPSNREPQSSGLTSQPPQRLTTNDALLYLKEVKEKFKDDKEKYDQFLEVMKDFKSQRIDTTGVIERVKHLFEGHRNLILGFNTFLPQGYEIVLPEEPPQKTQVEFEHAISYVNRIKTRFSDDEDVYKSFLEILNMYRKGHKGITDVYSEVANLFQEHHDLLEEFRCFLPDSSGVANVSSSNTSSKGIFHDRVSAAPPTSKFPQEKPFKRERLLLNVPFEPPTGRTEFDEKVKGDKPVDKVKKEKDSFAEMKKERPSEDRRMKTTVKEERASFEGYPLKDFRKHKEDVMEDGEMERTSFLKKERILDKPKDRDRREKELRDKAKEKGREKSKERKDMSQDHDKLKHRDKENFIAPGEDSLSRFPQKRKSAKRADELIRRQSQSIENGEAPHSKPHAISTLEKKSPKDLQHIISKSEFSFLEKVKTRVQNQDDYHSFLKCLELYTNKIIGKYELMNMVNRYIVHHPDLVKGLPDFLNRCEIPIADSSQRLHTTHRHEDRKFQAREKSEPKGEDHENEESENEFDRFDDNHRLHTSHKPSKTNFVSISEIDFSSAAKCTPSYRLLPEQYRRPYSIYRTQLGHEVLNDVWVSVTSGSEDYSFKHMRKNQFEESLFRCEDDRFELDMLLESCSSTSKRLSEVIETLSSMSADELSNFNIKDHLSPIHLRCIERIYGDHGLDVQDLLHRNPAETVPIVHLRLQQKHEEWSNCRIEMNKVWADVYAKNYHKSLDHRSFYFKQQDKKNMSSKGLLLEVKELSEKKRRNDDLQFSMGVKNRFPMVPDLQFSFPDPSMHDVVFQLIKFSAEEIESSEVAEKIVRFWSEFINPILGIHSKTQPPMASPLSRKDLGFENVETSILGSNHSNQISSNNRSKVESGGPSGEVVPKSPVASGSPDTALGGLNALNNEKKQSSENSLITLPKEGTNALDSEQKVHLDLNEVVEKKEVTTSQTQNGMQNGTLKPGFQEIVVPSKPSPPSTTEIPSMDVFNSTSSNVGLLENSALKSEVPNLEVKAADKLDSKIPSSTALPKVPIEKKENSSHSLPSSPFHSPPHSPLRAHPPSPSDLLAPQVVRRRATGAVFQNGIEIGIPTNERITAENCTFDTSLAEGDFNAHYDMEDGEESRKIDSVDSESTASEGDAEEEEDEEEDEDEEMEEICDRYTKGESEGEVEGEEGGYHEGEEYVNHHHQYDDDMFSMFKKMEESSTASVQPLFPHPDSADPCLLESVCDPERTFYVGESLFVLLRLYQTLYDRLLSAKNNAQATEAKLKILKGHTSQDLFLRFMQSLYNLLDGVTDNAKYEDECRSAVGTQSYVLFTLDNLIYKLVTQFQVVLNDEVSKKLFSLHQYQRSVANLMNAKVPDAYYFANAQTVSQGESVFRVQHDKEGEYSKISIQLMSNSSMGVLTVPPGTIQAQFSKYISSCLSSPPSQLADSHPSNSVFLKRNVIPNSLKFTKKSDKDLDSRVLPGVYIQNGLEAKFTCSTFKVSYVLDSEDIFYRPKRLRDSVSPPLRTHKRIKRSWRHPFPVGRGRKEAIREG